MAIDTIRSPRSPVLDEQLVGSQAVGLRLPRVDGLQHVMARTLYVDDLRFPEMLHVKVYRSPIVRGRILNVDVRAAQHMPGVAAVITWKDVPSNRLGGGDQPVLAENELRYLGQPIAAVAAADVDTAQEAVDQIRVDFEELPPVLDPLEAMQPEAPKVRPEGNLLTFDGRPYRAIRYGDVDQAFRKADVIVEGRYRTQGQEHAAIEPQVSVAVPDAIGRITIYTCTQAVWLNLATLSSVLRVPQSRIRMVGGVVGGGFGGKNDPHADPIVALLALKTGRPVKWRWTRDEEFLASTHRGATIMEFKDGVMRDGRIIARQVISIRDSGAYVSTNPYVVSKHAFLVAGPYFIPNVKVDAYAVFTNKAPTSSMRGFGVYQASFACETQMNRVAHELGMDPWEIRFINALRNGDRLPTRTKVYSVGLIEVMKEAATQAGVQLPDRLLAMHSSDREGRE